MLQFIKTINRYFRKETLYSKILLLTGCAQVVVLLLLFSLSGCNKEDLNNLDQMQKIGVEDSVKQMASIIAEDISRDGPSAWLKHFAKSPQFFMASEGKLVFPNNDSAEVFVKNFAKSVRSIHLNWTDLNVEPLSINLAVMRAYFHEVITDTSGHQMPAEGYFTGLAEHTSEGWKLRNLHWSLAGQGH